MRLGLAADAHLRLVDDLEPVDDVDPPQRRVHLAGQRDAHLDPQAGLLPHLADDGVLGALAAVQQAAREAVDAVLDAVPLRPCTQRIPARGAAASPCVLFELGRCAAPCAGHQDVDSYAPAVALWTDLVDGRADAPLQILVDAVAAQAKTAPAPGSAEFQAAVDAAVAAALAKATAAAPAAAPAVAAAAADAPPGKGPDKAAKPSTLEQQRQG